MNGPAHWSRRAECDEPACILPGTDAGAGIGTYLDSNDRRPIRTIVFIVFTAGLIGFLFENKTHVALTDVFQTIGAEAILKSRRDPIHVLLRDPDLPAPATIASTTE